MNPIAFSKFQVDYRKGGTNQGVNFKSAAKRQKIINYICRLSDNFKSLQTINDADSPAL